MDMNQDEIVSMIIEARDNGTSTLSLHGKGLEVLPAEISQLTNLVGLDLGLNDLTELPSEIGDLTNLANLKVDRNHLKTLPPEIGNLRNLAELNAGANDLTELPPEIGKLTNLGYLQLGHSQMFQRHNQLTRLPPEIGNMAGLTWMSLYPTFPIWLKSFLSNSSMVLQPLANYGPFLRAPSYNNSMICHFAVRCRRHHGGT